MAPSLPSPDTKTDPPRASVSRLYRFRCPRCRWCKDLRKTFDPGTVVCPACADGREIAWWSVGPADGFIPPPGLVDLEIARKAQLTADAEALKRGEGDGGWFRVKALHRGAMPTKEERQLVKLEEKQQERDEAARAREATRGQVGLPGLAKTEDRNLDHE